MNTRRSLLTGTAVLVAWMAIPGLVALAGEPHVYVVGVSGMT